MSNRRSIAHRSLPPQILKQMDPTIEWLMAGDPTIRWQTMRDLLGRPDREWKAERQRAFRSGWVAQFIDAMRPDGNWPTGRWTDTLWTLLTLVDCGLTEECEPVRRAAEAFFDRQLPDRRAWDRTWLLSRMDLCHLGFWLRTGATFCAGDERLLPLARTILSVQLADGGWNCRLRSKPATKHGSFHTTLNVLEGLELAPLMPRTFRAAEKRAIEFMLVHQLYRSDRTGTVIDERFTHLTYPSHWHYTVLRGLDYMRNRPEIDDARLADAIELIKSRRRASGRWPVEKRIPGTTLFEMEKMGGDSRWNTLRAMRVLNSRRRRAGGKR